jgi:Rrf2 family protein
MLSRTGEYALRAVLYLAGRAGDSSVPADDIAAAIHVPRNYLSKTLHRLAKRGVLKSVRGPRGGFRLARPAQAILVADVVSEFDHITASPWCLMGGRLCDPTNPCIAHERWLEWTGYMHRMLDRTTVADFLSKDRMARVPQMARNGTSERGMAAVGE